LGIKQKKGLTRPARERREVAGPKMRGRSGKEGWKAGRSLGTNEQRGVPGERRG